CRKRLADSTDSSSHAAASGLTSGRTPPSAWARRITPGEGGRVTGGDPSRAAITNARRRAGGDAHGAAMTFAVCVAQDLPLPDYASFDVVTCTLAIHHVPARQRPRAFEEMYRVLKPAGGCWPRIS